MKTVADLVSFILGSLKEEEAGRVALYHYLKNFHQPQAPVSSQLINEFFADALQLAHWQERRSELHGDIQDLLQRFSVQTGSPILLDQLWNLSRLQVVALAHCENLFAAVKNYEQAQQKEAEHLRLIPDGENRMVAIKKGPYGEITVRTYSNLVRLHGHSLVPLGPDQELHYNAALELLQDHIQKLRPAPHSQARFIVQQTGVEAQFTTGYAFRQSQAIKLSSISQEPRIFYPLKRLEKFYVYRSSDPYYMELVATLDKAIQMVRSNVEGAAPFIRQAFEGGQIAFDQIFPDDKALYVRLKELAKLISTNQPQDLNA